MTDQPATVADAPAPTPQPTQISEAQVRESIAAVHEVLNGAGAARILELSDKISLAKMVVRGIVAGELLIVRRPAPLAPPASAPPPNRKERRAARHKG